MTEGKEAWHSSAVASQDLHLDNGASCAKVPSREPYISILWIISGKTCTHKTTKAYIKFKKEHTSIHKKHTHTHKPTHAHTSTKLQTHTRTYIYMYTYTTTHVQPLYIRSLAYSHPPLITHSLITQVLTHSLIHPPTRSSSYSLTHKPIHSHSLTHLPTNAGTILCINAQFSGIL